MFLQWGSTVYVPRAGKDPWRFARSEMYLRLASPALTHSRNTDQACAEQAGPRAWWPLLRAFLPGSMALAHGATLRESACLRQARRQPCAQDHSAGPWGESAGSLSQTGNKGIVIVTMPTVETTSFFVGHAPTIPQHYRESIHSHFMSTIAGTNASPGARDRWLLFHRAPLLGRTSGPKKGPLSAVVLLGHRAENTPGFWGRSHDG